MPFVRRKFGRTGLTVSPLGLATGQGSLPAEGVERAFERGITTFYWGSYRASAFAEGLKKVAQKNRDRIEIVVQSYSRAACLMRGSLERALRKLGTDSTDVLLLGWWNREPPARILDAALELRERGLARRLMVAVCRGRVFLVVRDHRGVYASRSPIRPWISRCVLRATWPTSTSR